MKIGFWEIIVIAVVALLVIGPDKLPEYMRSLGKGLAGMRKSMDEVTSDIQKEVVEPLQEVAQPLKDALEPVQDTVAKVNDTVNDVNKKMNDIQHPIQASKKRQTEKKEQEKYWICPKCGNKAEGNFCSACGTAKALPVVEESTEVEKTDVVETEVVEPEVIDTKVEETAVDHTNVIEAEIVEEPKAQEEENA